MDYFDDYGNFYPNSSAREEFDASQFPDQTPVTEGVNYDVPYSTPTDTWGTPEQPGPIAGSSTSLPATDSYESPAPSTSHTSQTDGYVQPSYTGNYRPEVGQQAQPSHPGPPSHDHPPGGVMLPGPSTVDPTPGSSTLNNREGNQSGSSTGTFDMENVHTHHLPSTGPTRTGPTSMTRFQPYGRSRARRSEHVNAEAGPSTLIPPPVPCVGLPTPQPSGGMISETTADAESTQSIIEEDEAPAEPAQPERPYIEQMRVNKLRLQNWVKHRWAPEKTPTNNEALAIAFATISNLRPAEYRKHRLSTGKGKRGGPGSKAADREAMRREKERELFEDLSRYYPMARPNQRMWTRSVLFSLVMDELERLSTPPGPSDQPPP